MPSVPIRGYGIVSAFGAGSAPLVSGLRRGVAEPSTLSSAPVPSVNGSRVSALPPGLFRFDADGVLDVVLVAAREALERAGVRAPLGNCALTCGVNSLALAEHDYLRYRDMTSGERRPTPPPGDLAQRLAHALGATGPVLTFSTACSSSANALLHARDLILRGDVPRALVIGVESLAMITLSGFHSLMMLDPGGCRPFDAQRSGLQLGEGAAALLLERDGEGARVLGGANFCDTHHMTSASPDGAGMARAMRAALDDANITPDAVVAIKAHATASRDNDAAEAAALHTVFGATPPPITALKRYVGHTMSACGAIETAALLAALDAGFVPAAAGFSTVDPELSCAPLTQSQSAARGNYLLNYFGFGGNYASLVIAHG
ncbi:MAG TPA: beta-ketoacyl synthase N-terminal-like domain-containing protein [Burkholderiaceae bacterium]|nr:beta-ketoacyl synthase N-terminal-like domain-containing protein [Burkholderiaceae bacterium]